MSDQGSAKAWFRDAQSGEGKWSLDEVIYRSPDDNLLEVHHDLSDLQQMGPDKLKKLWDERWGPQSKAPQFGNLGQKELVLPDIPRNTSLPLVKAAAAFYPWAATLSHWASMASNYY